MRNIEVAPGSMISLRVQLPNFTGICDNVFPGTGLRLVCELPKAPPTQRLALQVG